MKEIRKYKLKAARKARVHPLLSGVAVVAEPTGKRIAYFSFSEEFVDAVGKALPTGVSQSNPAYIKVLYMPGRGTWRVFAMYFLKLRGVLLWEADDKPSWIS
jgi:hypothetical protein